MDHKPTRLDRVRQKLRLKPYSIRTEQAHVDWIKRFIRFHRQRHPASLGAPDVRAVLSHLAVERQVSTSTQRQAVSALVFWSRERLERDFGWLDDLERAKQPERLPVVCSPAEGRAILAHLDGQPWLMARLLYGAGLRVRECTRLRVKDVDFGDHHIVVRADKGQQDRVPMLPQRLAEPLQVHLEKVTALHAEDLAAGLGGVDVPLASARHDPPASRERGCTTAVPLTNGLGSRVAGKHVALRPLQRGSRGPSPGRSARPRAPSPAAATPFDTAALPIDSRSAMTSAPSRNSWAIEMAAPR
jgi:integrase